MLVDECRFKLLPFYGFTPEDWKNKDSSYDEVCDNMLGWDVTDYSEGKLDEFGFILITLRNSNLNNDKYLKPYAQRLLMFEEGQYAHMHFHWNKMEDIINRCGGNVLIKVYNSTDDGDFAETDVKINTDGREYYVKAGTQVCLTPDESMTIYPYMYYDFTIEEVSGAVLLGEVLIVNDDNKDNGFYEEIGRFPAVEEDEEPYRLLCIEYPKG